MLSANVASPVVAERASALRAWSTIFLSWEKRHLSRGQALVSRIMRQAVALASFMASSFSCTEAVCRNIHPFLVHSLPSSTLKQMWLLVLLSVFEEEAALASVFALALAFLALRSAVLEEELDVEVARCSSA